MPSERPIRVAVVDDHPSIGLAISAAIAADEAGDPPLAFAGEARTVEAARTLLLSGDAAGRPDVVLCDIQIQSGLDGLDVIGIARDAGVRAIVLTSFDRSSLMRAAFERGASGFLDKRLEPAEILAAVRRVARGGSAFSEAALDAARHAPRPPSTRELEVLREVGRGATSDEIGGRLGISARTVESHLRRLFDRYGVVSRTELAVLAVEQGWVDTAD